MEMTSNFKSQKIESLQKNYADLINNTEIQWLRLPQNKELTQTSISRAAELKKDFNKMVVLGIGGSSLGVRVIQEVLNSPANSHQLFVWDNVDALEIERSWPQLGDLNKANWVVTSKSGKTVETLLTLEYVMQKYKEQGISFLDKVTVITEKRSNPLYDWATKNSIPVLEIPVPVGGRFSVLTPVGILPAAFIGADVQKIMSGAEKAVKDQKNISYFVDQTLSSWERQEWITTFFFYNSKLRWFGDWLMQLWAESLAKKETRSGTPAPRCSTPFSIVGSSDQHSILQQLMEGAKDKFTVFFRSQDTEAAGSVLKSTEFSEISFMVNKTMGQLIQAQAIGTEKAMQAEGKSTMSMVFPKLDAEGLGYLIMFMQMSVGLLGEAMQINAYNQPGVELGKVLTKEKLSKA